MSNRPTLATLVFAGNFRRWRPIWLGLVLVAAAAGCECSGKKTPSRSGGYEETRSAHGWKSAAAVPGVYLINKGYDRTKSRVLIRRVVAPTRARLDFAAYDKNVLLFDPKDYAPTPPDAPASLAELDFNGALVKETLCDRLEQTPLSNRAKADPIAWLPMLEHLVEWDFEQAKGLAEVNDAVAWETWNDADVTPSYQEISRVYLHEEGGEKQLWVQVEFKPWVKFLEGVDDEDGDGFPEIYGRVRPEAVNEAVFERVAGDYTRKTLGENEIREWAFILGSYWYHSYDTYTLRPVDPEKLKEAGTVLIDDSWPDEEALAEAGRELADMPDNRPSIVIRGAPFREKIYLVLYVEGAEEE
ncbi:MAG TPA: hypothetical protein ENN09_01850 [Planctomycetes bacterium]|nr:hypothetical protein [Planctomycetota bacterium]